MGLRAKVGSDLDSDFGLELKLLFFKDPFLVQ